MPPCVPSTNKSTIAVHEDVVQCTFIVARERERERERKCSATKANHTEEPSRFFNLRTLKTEFWVKG